MRTRLLFHLLLLAGLVVPAACHKDSDEIIDQEDTPDQPGVIVTTGLVSVLDDPGLVSPQTFQDFAGHTDAFSRQAFLYNRAVMIDRDRTLLSLQTPDEQTFYQVSSLRENDINYSHWTVPTLSTWSGSTDRSEAFSYNGFEILIPAGGLTTEEGKPFEGIYSIHVAEITGQDAAMPAFSGQSKWEGPVSLLIGEAVYVGIRSQAGDPLTGTGDCRIIPPDAAGGEHWYFDPKQARWSGLAGHEAIPLTRTGYYCSAPYRTEVRAEGSLLVNGFPLPHYPIQVHYGDIIRTIYTTNAGHWQVLLPTETDARFVVPMPCQASLEIPFTTPDAATMTFPLSLEAPGVRNIAWGGTIRNCQADPVQGGFLVPEEDGRKVIYQPESEVNFRLLACPGEKIRIQAVDPETSDGGPVIPWSTQDTVHMGSVFTCAEAAGEYLYLSVSGERKMYWDLRSAVIAGMRLLIEDPNGVNGSDFRLLVSGMESRDYADTELNIVFEDMGLGQKGYSLYCPTSTEGCGFTRFTLTHFPDSAGGWIRGHFEGRFWIKSFNPLTAGYRPVTCDFQVYRDF